MFGYAWLSIMKFCECVVRCLCVQLLCRGGGGSMWVCVVKCRNFVECVVWWLMWVVFVVFVVCVGGSVVL